jgi:ribosomal protein L11 methyltransferase
MKWIEVSMSVDGEAAEAIAELLQRYGHQGVSIEQEGIMPEAWDDGDVPPITKLTVRAYFPADEQADDAKKRLETALGHMNMMLPMPTPVYKEVDDEDWANAWRAHFHPVRLGRRLVVWIENIETKPDDIMIAINPGMAFGTGTHPSTQLCLVALEDLIQPGMKVLDLGCGSGILSIAAAKLGASEILALDIDSAAVTATTENAAQNGTAEKITAMQGSLETVVNVPRRFDIAVVYFLAPIIVSMCDNHLGDILRPGGKGIFSGLLVEQADEVEAALRKTGLMPYARRASHNLQPDGDWVAIEALRPYSD